MFYKYRKSENTVRVLLIYLLLNNLNISEKMLVEEVEETRMFGLKIRKLYGVTDEVVDVRAIENEIESIQNPVICSPLSYEYYNDSPQIYVHTAHSKDSPLCRCNGIIGTIGVFDSADCLLAGHAGLLFCVVVQGDWI